jgi:hypothetical protein
MPSRVFLIGAKKIEKEDLSLCRKHKGVIKTRGESLTRDKSGGYLFTVRAVAGMKAA